MTLRHFLDLSDLEPSCLRAMLDDAVRMKAARRASRRPSVLPLSGYRAILLFEERSTRTRLSFEIAMRELGGEVSAVSRREIHLDKGETIEDTARVMSRYCDLVVLRTTDTTRFASFVAASAVPVINALTRRSHPCQILADVMTFEEKCGPIAGQTLAWSGDCNNVLFSLCEAARAFGFRLQIATPAALGARARSWPALEEGGELIAITTDPYEAARGARALLTDTVESMGLSDGQEAREAHIRALKPYKVTQALMDAAAPDAIFMHCMPAYRGFEVDEAVIDGPRSAIIDEAENRLHMQKAILKYCLLGPESLGA